MPGHRHQEAETFYLSLLPTTAVSKYCVMSRLGRCWLGLHVLASCTALPPRNSHRPSVFGQMGKYRWLRLGQPLLAILR